VTGAGIRTRAALGGLCALCLAGTAMAQQDFSSVEIQSTRLADGVFMLAGAGGNMAVSVGDDGALLVDTEYAPLTEKIQAAIRAAGGDDVKFVINTHWHGDHTGGNANFAQDGAVIVAQDNVKTRMSTEQVNFNSGEKIPPSPPEALPVVTFGNRTTLHWNGHTINVFHVDNAHTDGDSIIHFTDLNVFHMGDTFFNGSYPVIDVNSDGSLNGIVAAARNILARSNAETKIIPGHGPLGSREDLAEYVDVMSTIRDRIQSMIDQGRSEDEVVAADPTSEWDATWGAGFMNPETFTRLAYRSLDR
jgi:cyclase